MRAGIILADGFEESEAIVPIDILRRGGVDLKVISLNDNKIVSSSGGVTFLLDEKIINHTGDDFDLIILPGGMPGATNLSKSKEIDEILKKMKKDNKIIAAICASPVVVLASKGLFGDSKFTCYPGFEKNARDGKFVDENVVFDANFITSKGVGTVFDFAFKLLETIKGVKIMQDIKRKVLL